MGVRQVERCKERRQVNRPDGGAKAVVFVLGVESAKGNTARGEDQGAVPSDADSATNRPLNVGTRVHRQDCTVWEGQPAGVGQTGPIDRAFNTDHPLIDLIIVADIGAADHPARCLPDGTRESGAAVGVNPTEPVSAGGPGVTDLAADIGAGPGKDRNWRRWWREVCRKGRSGQSDGTH